VNSEPIVTDNYPTESQLGADQSGRLASCQESIGYSFKDISLLQSALTHASGASHRLASNERLEFLGDAVLGMVVCEWLFEEFPDYNEGDLTKIKSAVVSRRTCGRVAREMGLDHCLIVGRGVTRNHSFPRSLVSDVFESIIAAIYLDSDIETVKVIIRRWLKNEVISAIANQGAGNFKSALQQFAQRDLGHTPIYKLMKESGPDHCKNFLITAVIDNKQFPAAWGTNKKEAEQKAASNALAQLQDQAIPYPADQKVADQD
jgi:ribonuclease-3